MTEAQARITRYDNMVWASCELLMVLDILMSGLSNLEDSRERLEVAIKNLRWAVNGGIDNQQGGT